MHYFKQHFGKKIFENICKKTLQTFAKKTPATIGDKTFSGLISRVAPQQISLCKVK